jgi:subtilisin family serine protease
VNTNVRVRPLVVVIASALLVLAPAHTSVAAPSTPSPTSPGRAATGAESKPPSGACLTLAKVQGDNPLTAEQIADRSWAQEWLRYSDAWAFSRGEGVTVAVVDSGVDATQPLLKGHVSTGYDVTSGKTAKGGTSDCAAHGTAVASIIAAQPTTGVGLVGVAPGATIMPIRVTWGVNAEGEEPPISFTNFLRALQVAVSRPNVQVVNVSVTVPVAGLNAAQRRQMESVVRTARDKNILIVAASGNIPDGGDEDDRAVANYPAALADRYDNVIAVTGVAPVYGEDGVTATGYALNDTAVTGPWVTVAAPGGDMTCAMARSTSVVPCTGTSYAVPYVSGTAALIFSRYPGITPERVRQLIEMTAEVPTTKPGNSYLGSGMINPSAAVTGQLPRESEIRIPGPADPMPGPSQDRDLVRLGAYLTAGLALALAFLLPVGRAVLRRGRARGWRPGRTPPG